MSGFTLEDMLRLAHQHAEQVLVGKPAGEQVAPTFLMESERGARMLMQAPWRSDSEKDLLIRALAATMRARGIIRYSFVSEAWMATIPADSMTIEEAVKHRFTDDEMPRNRPDRREVVMTVAADRERSISAVYAIIRGEGGTVVKLEHQRDITSDPFYGRFSNLLKGSERD